MHKKTPVQAARNELMTFMTAHEQYLRELSGGLSKAGNTLDKSASGSWVGYHAALYFGDYEQPNAEESFDSEWGGMHGYDEKWKSRTIDDIWSYVHEHVKVGFDLDKADMLFKELHKKCKTLQDQIELAAGEGSTLANKAGEIDTKYSMVSYINAVRPNGAVSRDSKAINQGMKVPYHHNVLAFANAISKNLDNADKLLELSQPALLGDKGVGQNSNVWNYFNPFWLIYKGSFRVFNFTKNNKVKSVVGVGIILLGLLAIDYQLAWANTKNLWGIIIGFFGQ